MIISFADAILNKDPIALKYIEDATFSVHCEHEHNYMGYDPMKKGAFCERV